MIRGDLEARLCGRSPGRTGDPRIRSIAARPWRHRSWRARTLAVWVAAAEGRTPWIAMTETKPPTKLFFCYAPEDEPLRKELEKHLTLLERQGYITSWSGGAVGAGEAFRAEIERRIAEARVILLLVSADFLASDHLFEVELKRAFQRRAEGAEVLGVLLRPADWEHGELRGLEMLPRPRRFDQTVAGLGGGSTVVPVTEWSSHDAAFASVAEALRQRLRDWGYVSRISVNPSVAHRLSAPCR
jgi:hypothetical protein